MMGVIPLLSFIRLKPRLAKKGTSEFSSIGNLKVGKRERMSSRKRLAALEQERVRRAERDCLCGVAPLDKGAVTNIHCNYVNVKASLLVGK